MKINDRGSSFIAFVTAKGEAARFVQWHGSMYAAILFIGITSATTVEPFNSIEGIFEADVAFGLGTSNLTNAQVRSRVVKALDAVGMAASREWNKCARQEDEKRLRLKVDLITMKLIAPSKNHSKIHFVAKGMFNNSG
ncbi:putative metal abc transporter [Corchorus olitorius]|uniref:Metal abc transporter n=1 Tax=Corchorus olitorius TaxID=93759 RepID=A0A1R3HR83_9ROSI|nr:putative metal abc transporter [Corchorus olitorius]